MIETLRQAIEMVPPDTRRRWLLLIPLAVLVSLSEMGAAAGVFALGTILANPTAAPGTWVGAVVSRLPAQTPAAIVLQVSAVLAVYYAAKSVLWLWSQYLRIRISHDASARLASSMLRRYLSAPYSFHLRRNSAGLVRNCTTSVSEVLGGVLSAAAAFISDAILAAGMIALLFLTSPLPALAAAAGVAGMMWFVLRATRRIAGRHGDESYEVGEGILLSLHQAFGVIKELKVLGREQHFYDDFATRQAALRRLGYLGIALANMPPMIIQATLFCGALLMISVLAATGRQPAEILPVAAVFGYVGVRVIPIAHQFIVTANGIRARQRWVSELHRDYRELDETSGNASRTGACLTFHERIVLDDVTYAYPDGGVPALAHISLSIARGESLGIIGPTGAGKSTLVDLLLGLLPPTSGVITVDGTPLRPGGTPWHRRVGYVPQSTFLIDDTIRRNIALGIADAAIDDERVAEVMRMSRLESFVGGLPRGVETLVGERGVRLSGGERQRIAIARALYHDPELIVFDEATSALDVATEAEVTRTIQALGGSRTLVVIAHRLSSVKDCGRLVWLREGRVEAVGTFEDLRRQDPEFRAMAALSAV